MNSNRQRHKRSAHQNSAIRCAHYCGNPT
jgi:hypothetical protein